MGVADVGTVCEVDVATTASTGGTRLLADELAHVLGDVVAEEDLVADWVVAGAVASVQPAKPLAVDVPEEVRVVAAWFAVVDAVTARVVVAADSREAVTVDGWEAETVVVADVVVLDGVVVAVDRAATLEVDVVLGAEVVASEVAVAVDVAAGVDDTHLTQTWSETVRSAAEWTPWAKSSATTVGSERGALLAQTWRETSTPRWWSRRTASWTSRSAASWRWMRKRTRTSPSWRRVQAVTPVGTGKDGAEAEQGEAQHLLAMLSTSPGVSSGLCASSSGRASGAGGGRRRARRGGGRRRARVHRGTGAWSRAARRC